MLPYAFRGNVGTVTRTLSGAGVLFRGCLISVTGVLYSTGTGVHLTVLSFGHPVNPSSTLNFEKGLKVCGENGFGYSHCVKSAIALACVWDVHTWSDTYGAAIALRRVCRVSDRGFRYGVLFRVCTIRFTGKCRDRDTYNLRNVYREIFGSRILVTSPVPSHGSCSGSGFLFRRCSPYALRENVGTVTRKIFGTGGSCSEAVPCWIGVPVSSVYRT